MTAFTSFTVLAAELSAVVRVRLNMLQLVKILSGAILAFCLVTPVTAAVAHKWVDANGLTHYSDAAPGVDSGLVTQIDLPANSASNKAADDYYSITRQWQRLHQERIELEKLALEKARQQASVLQQKAEVVYVDPPVETGYRLIYANPGYRRYGYHRSHYRYGHRYGYTNSKGKRRVHGAGKRRNHGVGKLRNRSSFRHYSRIRNYQ